MVKLSKEKMFISLIVITLIALVVGNVASLATDLTNTGNTSGGSAVISPKAVNNTNAVGAITANNTTNNTSGGNTVGSIANNTSKNTSKNTSSYNSTGKLPYAGSDSTVIFVVIALAASALYAYKKVSDYNV